MKPMLKLFVILLTSVMFFACNNDEDENKGRIKTLKIAHYRDYFINPILGSKTDILGYVAVGEDEVTYVIDCIKGFEDKYELGYEYIIKVKVVSKGLGEEPKQDLFGNDYYFIEIISKNKIDD